MKKVIAVAILAVVLFASSAWAANWKLVIIPPNTLPTITAFEYKSSCTLAGALILEFSLAPLSAYCIEDCKNPLTVHISDGYVQAVKDTILEAAP